MEYGPDEMEFMLAVDRWKAITGNQYPTLCELLRIAKGLGYEKVPQPRRAA